MSASQALEIYRDRDAIEKVFRMEKIYLGNDVFRVHLDEHLESKFIKEVRHENLSGEIDS